MFQTIQTIHFLKALGPRISKLILPSVSYTNTQIQIHKYTNTPSVKVPHRPYVCYIFGKHLVQGPQKVVDNCKIYQPRDNDTSIISCTIKKTYSPNYYKFVPVSRAKSEKYWYQHMCIVFIVIIITWSSSSPLAVALLCKAQGTLCRQGRQTIGIAANLKRKIRTKIFTTIPLLSAPPVWSLWTWLASELVFRLLIRSHPRKKRAETFFLKSESFVSGLGNLCIAARVVSFGGRTSRF